MNTSTPRREYRRHGLATPENLPTYNAVYDVLRYPWTRVAPCWHDRVDFGWGVIAEIGRRPTTTDEGRFQLASREDLSYLLDGTQPEHFVFEEFFPEYVPQRLDHLPPWVEAGYVFQPGHVEWRWVPFNRKAKSTKPRPEVFIKSEFPDKNPERQRGKRRLRADERSRPVSR